MDRTKNLSSVASRLLVECVSFSESKVFDEQSLAIAVFIGSHLSATILLQGRC